VGVRLSDGSWVRRYVHRFVLELATGICPEDLDACHNDGNRLNNSIDNLRWDTRKSNFADMEAHGTKRRGSCNPRAVLTEKDVIAIRNAKEQGAVQRHLADLYRVSPMTISRIVRHQLWNHI